MRLHAARHAFVEAFERACRLRRAAGNRNRPRQNVRVSRWVLRARCGVRSRRCCRFCRNLCNGGDCMSASHTVVLDGVSFHYLDEAELAAQERPEESHESCVRGVKLDIPAGTCTVLCGRSGDGKSTVLRLIDGLAGTFFPGERKGAVLVGGADVLDISPRQRTESMGVVMQDPRSQFFMGTVADEIAFSLENLGIDPSTTVERVREAANLCGVDGLLT